VASSISEEQPVFIFRVEGCSLKNWFRYNQAIIEAELFLLDFGRTDRMTDFNTVMKFFFCIEERNEKTQTFPAS
jgi:hypothetical protein